jgi:hypothetical protein
MHMHPDLDPHMHPHMHMHPDLDPHMHPHMHMHPDLDPLQQKKLLNAVHSLATSHAATAAGVADAHAAAAAATAAGVADAHAAAAAAAAAGVATATAAAAVVGATSVDILSAPDKLKDLALLKHLQNEFIDLEDEGRNGALYALRIRCVIPFIEDNNIKYFLTVIKHKKCFKVAVPGLKKKDTTIIGVIKDSDLILDFGPDKATFTIDLTTKEQKKPI